MHFETFHTVWNCWPVIYSWHREEGLKVLQYQNLGGGSNSHWPVYVMYLSLFCIGFQNFTHSDPLFLLFWSKFSSKIIKFCKSRRKFHKNVWKLPRFCTISHPYPPFFDLSPNDPLFCKKIVTDGTWFDASVSASSLLYVSGPPGSELCLSLPQILFEVHVCQ